MKIKVVRIHKAENFTVGKLFIDDEFICYTLEDTVRQIEGKPVAEWKIQNQTAIPTGTYPLTLTFSNRFQRILPLINNVEGFIGIRIHTGNSPLDTDGCILVGSAWDGTSGWISGSKEAFSKLFPILDSSTEEKTIEVV